MTRPATETLLLGALGFATLECHAGPSLSVVGDAPLWLSSLIGQRSRISQPNELIASSPFLADFLQEVDDFLAAEGTILRSGTWSQRDPRGDEKAYEAWALRLPEGAYILIRVIQDFEERRTVFQKSRELALSHELLGRRHRELGEMNQMLQTRSREVQRLNDLKSEFLASMSHELRTPLSAIIGFSTLLEEQKAGPLNTRQRDYVNHIDQAGRHLLALINDVLDLSRIEAGHLELRQEYFRFCDVLTEVLATIRPLARAKNITFSIGVGPAEFVYADRLRLKQILYNLLHNAIKFTPDFGEVSVDCSREPDSVVISVTDNGVGVVLEEQQAIFEKFHQAAQPFGGRREGTGLGLAITRQLVERHGGNIWVESAPGSATRFLFRLPHPYSQE